MFVQPSVSNAQFAAAAAPSPAYPLPQQSRQMAHPISVPGHPSADPGPRPARGLAAHLGDLEVVGDVEVVMLVVGRVHRLVLSVWDHVRLVISYLDGPNTSTQFGKDSEEFRDVARPPRNARFSAGMT